MKKIYAPIAFLAVMSSQVSAQANDELWRGLRAGMTKSEVAVILPKKETDLLPDCRASVSLKFVSERLISVTLSEKWLFSKNNCSVPVGATLAEKYGTSARSEVHVPAGKFTAAEDYEINSWIFGSTEVIFRRQINGKKWSLMYRIANGATPSQRVEGL
jgi:hypothetical protein